MPNKKEPVAIGLRKIEELSLFLHTPQITQSEIFALDNYKVKLSSRVKLDDKDQTLSIFLIVDIKDKSDYDTSPNASSSDKLPSIHCECAFTYALKGLNLKVDITSGTFNAPVDVVNKLGEISLSTFRGIMFNKCSTTVLKEFTLPLLSPEEIVTLMRPSGSKDEPHQVK